MEVRVGQLGAEEGVQKRIVGEHCGKHLRKGMTPPDRLAGSSACLAVMPDPSHVSFGAVRKRIAPNTEMAIPEICRLATLCKHPSK